MKNRPLLIAAAGSVNPNLYGDLGRILTSHIPLSGKLAILDQVEKAIQKYETVYVLMDESAKNLARVLKSKFGVTPIFGNFEDSMSQTFCGAFDKIDSNIGLDIVFGDSYNTDLLEINSELKDQIFVSKRLDRNSWKCIQRNSTNLSLEFFDNSPISNEVAVVTGSFSISNFLLFRDILLDEADLNSSENYFWNTWVKYDRYLSYSVDFIQDESWQDIGHVDTYFMARRDLISKSARSFNQIAMDKSSLRITKTGIADKIRLEKKWFDEIPSEIHRYSPNTFSSKVAHGYEIEYETSIPANEMWISGNNDDSYWHLLGQSLSQLMEVMHSIDDSTTTVDEQRSFKKEMFSIKVNQRIETFLRINKVSDNFLDRVKLNGNRIPRLQVVLEEIEKVSEKVSGLGNWSIIHGDLCLSNMIYDRRKNQLKLIDPRGSFVKEGIYGDPIYDLIKLSHSILGNYDYFACNLFYLSQFESEFELSVAEPSLPRVAKEICEEVITSQLGLRGISYQDLRILESGLFLSASAMHTETDRGLALLLNGLQIANEVIQK
jgi:hypothetical protein